ncbi:MAG: hypothetical protein WBD31_30420 [Rubripirellula sp.]
MKTKHILAFTSLVLLVFLQPCFAQEDAERANIHSSINDDGTGKIIVEARGTLPEPPVFFTASAKASAVVSRDEIDQVVELKVKVIQGRATTISLGLRGDGEVVGVEGDEKELRSWSVRRAGDLRFLDLHVTDGVTKINAEVVIQLKQLQLPAAIELAHLAAGDAVGFDSIVAINFATGVAGSVTKAEGFSPLDSAERTVRFQTATGGALALSIHRDEASPSPVELVGTTLKGNVDANGKSIQFQLRGTARVSEPDVEIVALSGNAAVSQVPANSNYRLKLAVDEGQPVYKLVFAKAGEFPIELDFVATIAAADGNAKRMDFSVAAAAVVPLSIDGLASDLEFQRDQSSIVPLRDDKTWKGFLPATGRAKLNWKAARRTGEGKLFFTTTGHVEAKVGAGLLRQDHQIDYKVLQGELKSLSILLLGPGEILDVQSPNMVGWKVVGKGNDRQLDVTLSQPITSESRINIRSQTPLGAFPVRVEGLRLNPIDAIRHSGYVRLTNLGSVRLEPTGLSGLTQLAPDQFPGKPIESRQVFVYRFPAADYGFTVAADRIQPEVNVSELVLYELTESDRVIRADVELDIREAPIREWDFGVPADHSVVAVTGASVADYIAATEVTDGRRNLKVIFGQDIRGRQLVSLHLEKSESAVAGDWVLPHIEYPEARTVRGDIGIIGAPGFRISVGDTQLLVEKPLSYFPKPSPHLQQAFRIREPGWTATMQIELLQRSVQSDVFHLYSLNEETAYGSALINFFVAGSPMSEWKIHVPPSLGNVMVDGQDIRTWRREGETLIVSLHQPVMGAYTLLVTFEEKPSKTKGSFLAGQVAPIGVQGERGFIQVVSPMQVEISTDSISDDMLKLDPLELPAELRLLSTAPPLGTWQYTERPFDLNLDVRWFKPGMMATQVVEFAEANSRVSQDGELVTDVLYFVKSRGQRTFKIKLPDDPVRLWAVSVDGHPVTPRQADDETLIPLPGGLDPNIPAQVSVRLGKPTVSESSPELMLPIVFAPVLKTQWNIVGDQKHVLVPNGGTVTPSFPVLRPSGFNWVAKQGIVSLLLIGLFSGIGIWGCRKNDFYRVAGLLSLAIAIWISASTASAAYSQMRAPAPLQLSLPILSTGEMIQLQVSNTPMWRANLSWLGVVASLAGVGIIGWSFTKGETYQRVLLRIGGILLVALGALFQGDGAALFFSLLAAAILVLLFAWPAIDLLRKLPTWMRDQNANRKTQGSDTTVSREELGSAGTTMLLLALFLWPTSDSFAAPADGFEAADSIHQQWQVTHQDSRLKASGTIKLSGKPGDRFVLLRAPAVLSHFEGKGLRLTKNEVPQRGLAYIVSIPITDKKLTEEQSDPADDRVAHFEATFEFQLEAVTPTKGLPVLTGVAAVQVVNLSYDQPGWDVTSPTAIRIETDLDNLATEAKVLLGPGTANLVLKPKERDVTTEEKQFFVEASNLYLPGPGVVDGNHRLNIRTSQGQVDALNVIVPSGFTVSDVTGPVGSWQFDADSGQLKMEVEPAQSSVFDVMIETQRGLDPLPTDVTLSPLKFVDADGEVGLVAIAFGPEAQPEKSEPKQMSAVNLGDFDANLVANKQAVVHRVYRYGADGGEVLVRAAPVAPEVRVLSKQVLSLGDERVVLAVNFAAEITRAGLFQLSFPLPSGLEVESLSGDALHHWAELTEGGQRQIILHLSGKTIGTQNFSLALSGTAPTDVAEWKIPKFVLNEATRQTSDLVVRPTTGIRLRTVSRQNVSETDPRTMGGETQGALAFRLLQRDWNLVLGIEKLDPWITGQVLHEVTLREGQTRTALIADFNVQNASIRSLRVVLPITDADEIKTLRASGNTVSDFVRTAPDSNIWEVQFKRRVVGKIDFRIEYQRRGDRRDDIESLKPAEFPQSRQLSYFFGIRAGGRLQLEPGELSDGWQRIDWMMVPAVLREAENRTAPAFALRAVTPARDLVIHAKRHSLADALKLRVADGVLTTVLSPTGDQLTSVDVTIEVIRRSSLIVGLPAGGELLSIFVNGESVNSIRQGGVASDWQFTILPGIDDRNAKVRFVYSVPGNRLSSLSLVSPNLNVPLENIVWNVVAPRGFELVDSGGNLELVSTSNQETYDRTSYLSKVKGKRQVQAQQATQLLEQANQLLRAGEQSKAGWALNSVANRYGLDAASNEDARVQLENLQTQQAIVGLNTRRQQLYLDNVRTDGAAIDNKQLREAAAHNPILQQDQLNFRPQELSQLLRGNTTADNAILGQIATRLVQHQHNTQPAPQAILISLPEEGSVYSFGRSVQVAENKPLSLDLNFGLVGRLPFWRTASVFVMLVIISAIFAFVATRKEGMADSR